MKDILAVDIGSQFIKILDVRAEGESLSLRHFVFKEISDNGARIPEDQITKNIKDLTARMDLSSADARTTVSGKSVIVRNVDFPNAGKSDILRNVREQENKYLPVDLHDYFFDVGLLSVPGASDKKALKGFIAAAKKEAVVNHVKVLNNAGLNTVLVDVNSLALMNLYEAVLAKTGKEDNITALVDLGASSAHVGILLKDSSIFFREINIGGVNITRNICERLSCDFNSAETMKKGETEGLFEYAVPVINAVVKELTMSFHFFEGESGRNVERIFFTGGGVLFKGIAEKIAGGLDMPYEVLDPLSLFKIDVKEDKDLLKAISPVFAVCAGLVVRGVETLGKG